MIDLKAIDAWERWWNTKPEPHIPAPKQCAMNQDKMMAVWLSAWDAASQEVNQLRKQLDLHKNAHHKAVELLRELQCKTNQ